MGSQQSSPFSQPPVNSDTADASNPNTSLLCDVACQKQRALASAQKAYQIALANKDSDPTTYQLMRYKYFSLKEGPTWAQQEKARIAKQDIDPVVEKLRDSYREVNGQFEAQRQLVDMVDTVQRQQEAMRKESEGQVKLLQDDIEEKKAKIGVYNRSVDLASEGGTTTEGGTSTLDPLIKYFGEYPSNFQTILDVAIGIIIFLMVIILLQRSRALGEKVKNLQVYTASGMPLFGASPLSPRLGPTASALPSVPAQPGRISRAISSAVSAASGYWPIIGLSAVLIALSLIIAYEGNKL